MLRNITLATLLLAACVPVNARDSTAALAQCEANAYRAVGVQADRIASLEYLEAKYELVRVCLVGQGLQFDGTNWQSFAMKLDEVISTARGTWGMPMASPQAQASSLEFQRQVAMARMTSRWWK